MIRLLAYVFLEAPRCLLHQDAFALTPKASANFDWRTHSWLVNAMFNSPTALQALKISLARAKPRSNGSRRSSRFLQGVAASLTSATDFPPSRLSETLSIESKRHRSCQTPMPSVAQGPGQ